MKSKYYILFLLFLQLLSRLAPFSTDLYLDPHFSSEFLPAEILNVIPYVTKNIWIAVVNKTEVSIWDHVRREAELNPQWTLHICDNKDKDDFINTAYANTSLQWAYNNINPVFGGAAKADIWRYAVLYKFGGVYVDADSFLSKPLDSFVRKDDTLIVTFEQNHYDGDWCYSPHSEFSTLRNLKRHPSMATVPLFHGRNLLNWCIISGPGHRFLRQTMINFVKLVRLEYLGLSPLKMAKYDKYSKHVYCTTGPSLLTASCRQVLLEEGETAVPVPVRFRLASRDFIREGGVFKVINTVKNEKNHYTKVTVADHTFLLRYAPENETIKAIQFFVNETESTGGLLVMGRYKKSVYALQNGQRRPFGGMDVLLALNYSLTQVVHLSDFVISQIPLGPVMKIP